MKSSYILNNYGILIQALLKVIKPECCVEIGIFEGFSTFIIGSTLKKIGKGKLFAYDLFEDYKYTHAEYNSIKQQIERYQLNEVVTIKKKNIFNVAEEFKDQSIDFMHIDISNTGEIIRKSIQQFDSKIKPGGLLIFEGGSPLRDEVEWVNRYGKEKCFQEIQHNKILCEKYTSVVLHPYPSITICSKNVKVDDQVWIDFGFNDYSCGRVHGEISEEDFLADLVK